MTTDPPDPPDPPNPELPHNEDPNEFDAVLGDAMLDAAQRATADAELYALDRSLDEPDGGWGLPPWSEVSEPEAGDDAI
jgi:hypothetical protein